jgi:hypothetical protein
VIARTENDVFVYLSCLKCRQKIRKGRWRTHKNLCFEKEKISLVDAALLAIAYHPKLRDKFPDENLLADMRIILTNLWRKKCMKYVNAVENIKNQI